MHALNESLLTELNELREIVEFPRLYLINYFIDLKNQVDKQFALKQFREQNIETNQKLSKTWQNMISFIDLFEKECLNQKMNHHITKLDELEKSQTSNDSLMKAIVNMKTNILRQLFNNKTIVFLDDKLIQINDHFISPTVLLKQKR